MKVKAAVVTVVCFLALLVVPVQAMAHGGAESAAASGMQGEEAEVKALSMQPARVLAQQALATLRVRGDTHEAGIRLDAALESKDKSAIDVAVLRKGTETLDNGDAAGAIPLLDEALSRPLGAASGKALHEAGREFQPATGAQEIVGIVAGGALLALGAFLLVTGRRRQRPKHGG
jgi:LPXTG-motif cell wall-anchored protein